MAEQRRLQLFGWESEEPSGVLAIRVCGEEFAAHPIGALYHRRERSLVVLDLHLEQGASIASRGYLIPSYDTHATIARLSNVIDHFEPERVISPGDSFHGVNVANHLGETALGLIAELQEGRE